MQLVAAQDRAACERFVCRLLPRVQRLARALLRNTNHAEDASQASLLELLGASRSFRGESSLERWADRITVRTSLRWVRGERRRSAAALTLAAEPSTPEQGTSRVLFEECLDGMPEPQRVALVLRCSFEYTIDEIAELSGCSPNTVKDRLLRAKAAVRSRVRREPREASQRAISKQ
jgi:RNA polymerase sigma factor (sigma-70 family)